MNSRVLLGLISFGLAGAVIAAKEASSTGDKAVEASPYVVRDFPVCSFGVGLRGLAVKDKVIELLITEVTRDSDAERAGLRAGDIVLSVNGVRVADLVESKELTTLLVNRPWGERVDLEVEKRRRSNVTLRSTNRTVPTDRQGVLP